MFSIVQILLLSPLEGRCEEYSSLGTKLELLRRSKVLIQF